MTSVTIGHFEIDGEMGRGNLSADYLSRVPYLNWQDTRERWNLRKIIDDSK